MKPKAEGQMTFAAIICILAGAVRMVAHNDILAWALVGVGLAISVRIIINRRKPDA
jgi:hypothetical protein